MPVEFTTYVYEAEKLSVRLSILSFWHADSSAVCALIKTELSRNALWISNLHTDFVKFLIHDNLWKFYIHGT